MLELNLALTALGIVVLVLPLLLLGGFLNRKIGRTKLVAGVGITGLFSLVAFVICAVILLT